MIITFYGSDVRDDPANTKYPHEFNIDTKVGKFDPSMFTHDYVGPLFNGSRAGVNFVKSNCLLIDIDNDHSDNPSEWFDKDDLENVIKGVPHIIHYSRNHMVDKPKKNKNGVVTIKQKRPKMHIIIAANIKSKEDYDNLITRLMKYLPIIDPRAKDAAHFFFGTEKLKNVKYFLKKIVVFPLLVLTKGRKKGYNIVKWKEMGKNVMKW